MDELTPEAQLVGAVNVIRTSLGMKPGDDLPFSAAIVDRASLVAECVIAPEITPLLELARRNGRKVHTGVPMLAAQMNMLLEFMGVQ